MLNDISMLGAETRRTRAYINALRDNDLLPSTLVLMKSVVTGDKFDIEEAARAAGVPVIVVEAEDVNSTDVIAAIDQLPQRFVIYSGPAGTIVRRPLFATGKKFIHVHPGRLPDFRGSTTIYYSLLAEKKIELSALLLNEEIDGGPVIGRAEFDPPADRSTIDYGFDPTIRASLLVSVLREYAEQGRFREQAQAQGVGESYYIIHPVLKHIAILAS